MSWPIQVALKVQWGDMDALGHVNNARYFTFFETARIALFEKVGLVSDRSDLDAGPILATIQAQFRAPLHYPDNILACCRVKRLGNTSFTLSHAVVRAADPDTVIASGDGVVVLLNYKTGEKVPLSNQMRAALEGFQ
ncbi:MAG: acyl-CoA thioesterase [Rhodobacterales bacterium]|nr:acyl-CoA thioesterase [Rhodobacterales bacterium]